MSEYKSPFTGTFEQQIRELIRDELSRHDAETVRAMSAILAAKPGEAEVASEPALVAVSQRFLPVPST